MWPSVLRASPAIRPPGTAVSAGGSLGGGTFGGTGFYIAKVGGLWDALSAKGRKFFNFASSDCHGHWSTGGSDFWPGEFCALVHWRYRDSSVMSLHMTIFLGGPVLCELFRVNQYFMIKKV